MPNISYNVCTMASAWPSYAHHWEPLSQHLGKKDLNIILDEGRSDLSKIKVDGDYRYFIYDEGDLRTNLNFHHEPSKQHFWNHRGNRNIIWFYAALRMMNYYLKHPDDDYYWFFDDDVSVSDWPKFLDGFSSTGKDFLAYYTFKEPNVSAHPEVPHVSPGMHSYHSPDVNWFSRFPGHGDKLPFDLCSKLGSFFAIVRFSNEALRYLVKMNEQGYLGYSEGFVPTVLAEGGFDLGTIYRPDNTSVYVDPSVTVLHKNTKITWSWL